MYDFRNDHGHGLGTDPSGHNLMVHMVGERLRRLDQLAITLTGKSSQFGFGIGAWQGPVSVQVLAGDRPVGAMILQPSADDDPSGNGKTYFFECSQPFDQILISIAGETEKPTWVLTFIASQRRFTVPALSPVGFVFLMTGLLALGVFLNRRSRTTGRM